MQEVTAQLNNLRLSPRKVRLVANLVRGKKATDAILTLQFADKRASFPVSKLIASAVANAKAQSIDIETLIVKKIEVNAGKTLMRRIPAPHGSAHPLRKRTSHVFVLLGTKEGNSHEAVGNSEEKKVKVEIKEAVKPKAKVKAKRSAPKLKTNA